MKMIIYRHGADKIRESSKKKWDTQPLIEEGLFLFNIGKKQSVQRWGRILSGSCPKV